MTRGVAAITPIFSADWSGSRDYWPTLLAEFAGQPDLRFLEVGCFEGRATLWMLEHILTDPSSMIFAVDTFQGSPEFPGLGIDGNSRGRFEANLAAHIAAGKVTILEGASQQVLSTLSGPFDFVYIDGSHRAADVLADAEQAWPLLKTGGLLAFDDYDWGLGLPETERPREAIDSFLAVHAAELRVRHHAYQVAVEKL